MKRSIPCNETHFTNGKDRNQIIFRFVTDDRNTPSACTVRIGDTDPVTGEPITDMDFFQEYHRQADKEIHRNINAMRKPYTKEQKAWREAKKQEYIHEFEEAYGYSPSNDDIRYYLEQIEEERYHMCIDDLQAEDSDSGTEKKDFLAVPSEDPFGTDLPETICILREIEASLSPRLKAVYQAMLQRAGGGAERTTYKDLAGIWNVSYGQIIKDTRKIEKMIRDKITHT